MGNAQIILSPNGDVPGCDYTDAWPYIDEYPTDNATTDFQYEEDDVCSRWTFTASGLSGSPTIDSVKLVVRMKNSSAPFGTVAYILVGVATHGIIDYLIESSESINPTTSSYQDFSSPAMTTNIYTGSPWTVAELDDLEARFYHAFWTGNEHTKVTTVYYVVYCSTCGGGGGSTSFPTKQLLLGVGK